MKDKNNLEPSDYITGVNNSCNDSFTKDDVELIWKILEKNMYEPFVQEKYIFIQPFCVYKKKSKEERERWWQDSHSSMNIYFMKNAHTKNEKIYKLVEGGKLKEVEEIWPDQN